MMINKFKRWDIRVLLLVLFLIIVIHLSYHALIIRKFYPSNIGAIYEKIKICLTSTSILLATSSFFISGHLNKNVSTEVKYSIKRTFIWLIISLFSGMLNVAIIPVRLDVNSYLQFNHVALWFWLYLTGPIMYISLLIGAIWFFIMTKEVINYD